MNYARWISILTIFLCLSAREAHAQCTLLVEGDPSQTRTGPNEFRGRSLLYPVTIIGTWNVTLTSDLKYAGTVLAATKSTNFNWGPGSTLGSGGAEWADAITALEPLGSPTFRTYQSASGVCSGTTWTLNPVKQTIAYPVERPAYPFYSPSTTFLSYYGGQNSNHTTSGGRSWANSTNLTPGNANGATGSFTWELAQSSPGYASLSCTNCNPTTITALKESDGCAVYNVQVRTNYGGYKSEPLYVAIERPKRSYAFDVTHEPWGALGGYRSTMRYRLEGLCSAEGYLAAYTFNESFGSTTNYVSNNWPLSADTGVTLGAGSTFWGDQNQAVAGNACGGAVCSPVPVDPGSPLGTTLIHTAHRLGRLVRSLPDWASTFKGTRFGAFSTMVTTIQSCPL